MVSQTGAARSRYIDQQVVQRVLKATDAVVLFAAALVLSVLTLEPGAPAHAEPLIGFLALVISLTCILAMRGLDLYTVPALTRGASTALRCMASSFACGGTVFGLAAVLLMA